MTGLIDDTGRRVSEVCRLVGADVDRREQTVRVRQKGRRALVLPVSPEVLALLPERAPDAWLFARRLRGGGLAPAHRDAVRRVVRRAIVALDFFDGEIGGAFVLRRGLTPEEREALHSEEPGGPVFQRLHAEMRTEKEADRLGSLTRGVIRIGSRVVNHTAPGLGVGTVVVPDEEDWENVQGGLTPSRPSASIARRAYASGP